MTTEIKTERSPFEAGWEHPDGGNHKWTIEPPNGMLSRAECECKAVRYFANSSEALKQLSR